MTDFLKGRRCVACRLVLCGLVSSTVLSLVGCGGRPDSSEVSSHLQGFITVRAEVDSVQDYRGFEVFVASADGRADTLGLAVTDSTGYFNMSIVAPERGIYPLLVRRRGVLLKQGQIVVADGDSATLNLRIPDGRRPLVIRSTENAAWLAYRNTKAMHNRELLSLVQSGDLSEASRARRFYQTAELLWNLRGQFPRTIGAQIASAESVLLLEGIGDSLALARAVDLDVDGSGFDEVARAVRRAESRLRGLDAAIDTLRSYERSSRRAERKAAITSEIVLALVDSGRVDDALQEARRLVSEYQGTEWASWAEQAAYELQNLMPGMEAPAMTVRTWSGETFVLENDAPGTTVLEFFRPGDSAFLREAAVRDSLVQEMTGRGVTYVSISVEPDSVINEAFFESREGADVRIALAGGLEDPMAEAYNVKVVPRRFLLNDGVIVAKYSGAGSLNALGRDVFDLAERPPS